jgi:hypothetical protein
MSKTNRNEKRKRTDKTSIKKLHKEVQQALAKPVMFFFWNVSGIVEYASEGITKTKTLNVFHRSMRPMVLAELEQANLKLYATFQERTKKELLDKVKASTPKEIALKEKMLAEMPDLEVKSITMLAVSYLGTFTIEQWREGIQMPQEATQEAPQTTEQPAPAVTPAT